ncbi:MAG: EAL domain-containing protein [Oscillospiraceae bacterium]|nr:EAL domain-containing protein [Oscillospiraceae bacterium]
MQYNPYLEIASLLVLAVIAVHFFGRPRFPSRRTSFFGLFLIVALVDLSADIASAFLIECAPRLLALSWSVCMLLYLCQTALAPMFFIYILSITHYIDDRRLRPFIAGSLVPALVAMIMVALNPLTHHFFYFEDSGAYYNGPLLYILYTMTVGYLALSGIFIVKKRSMLRRAEYDVMLGFTTLIILAIYLQAMRPELLLTGVALTISILMLYLVFQNPADRLDTLSGTFDREAFKHYVGSLIEQRRKFSIAMFDITDLAGVNRTFGNEAGDRTIAEVGAFLLKKSMGKGLVFRVIGDSFSVVCTREKDCADIARMTAARFKNPGRIGELALQLQSKALLFERADRCLSAEELREVIDSVFYTASRADGEPLAISDETIESVRRLSSVEDKLRRALAGGGGAIEVHYQPVFSLEKNRVVGAEALARLRDEEGKLIPPSEFIPLAERSGLIIELSDRVLETVCRFISENGLFEDGELQEISVNLSIVECLAGNLEKRIEKHAGGIDRSKLCFEITESTATAYEKLPEMLERIKSEGHQFFLDDFGTGYANFDSVMRLPVSAVKLDKSLLYMAAESEKNKKLLYGTIDMVRAVGMNIIAEGAENPEQVKTLAGCGIDLIQGFYFSRPLSAAEFLSCYKSLGANGSFSLKE